MKLTISKSIVLSLLVSHVNASPIVTREILDPPKMTRESVDTNVARVADPGRIVGGEKAEVGEYPYFVEMGGCGGTLIAPDIVLFAAHCPTELFLNKQVTIGGIKTFNTHGGAEGRFCDQIISDPRYGADGVKNNYDFALCKLNRPIENYNKGKVRLEMNWEHNFPEVGADLVVMGYGKTSEDGPVSPDLLHVTVKHISNDVCAADDKYGGTHYTVTENMLCASVPNGGMDACGGDSGGPIVTKTVNNDGTEIHTHVGVVSWGLGCANPNYPGVYARTSKRANWIKKTMCTKLMSVDPICNNPAPTCNNADVSITLTTDKYGFETSWTLSDSSDKEVLFRQYKIPFFESVNNICLNYDECYSWTVEDDFGDGSGPYSIKVNGEQIVSKGTNSFGKTKTEQICTGPAPEGHNEQEDPSGDMIDPAVCEDDESFRYNDKNRNTCAVWLDNGKLSTTKRRCGKNYLGQKIKNYWCRKTCSEALKKDGSCFPLKIDGVVQKEPVQRFVPDPIDNSRKRSPKHSKSENHTRRRSVGLSQNIIIE